MDEIKRLSRLFEQMLASAPDAARRAAALASATPPSLAAVLLSHEPRRRPKPKLHYQPARTMNRAEGDSEDTVVNEDIVEFLARVMRLANTSLETQVRQIQACIKVVPPKELHIGFRELWRVGLNDAEFKELCAFLSESLSRWKASMSLRISEPVPRRGECDDDPEFTREAKRIRSLAAKNLEWHLKQTPTILHWHHAARTVASSSKGGNILIPIIYFPDKSRSEIDKLRKYKSSIVRHRPSNERVEIERLQEEPVPGFEMARLFKRE